MSVKQESNLQWIQFAHTGSIYDYLDYKGSQQDPQSGKENHADGDDRTCTASGEGGGSRSDSDDSYT